MSAADMLDRSGRRGSGEEFEKGTGEKGEWGHGTFERFAKGVSGDARHGGGTEISILVRFEASNVGLCYRREGEM